MILKFDILSEVRNDRDNMEKELLLDKNPRGLHEIMH